jgi:nucleoside-diphosphate-sugar epimerase
MSVILITGGNGFVGRRLVAELVGRGDSVRVLALSGDDTSWLETNGANVYRGDVRERASLEEPIRGADAVVHLAGLMGAWLPEAIYHAVNVTGTENVCEAALTQGVRRVVHVSSWTAYGMGVPQAVREDHPLRPLPEPYARTKAGGDLAVQRMIATEQLPAVIIRPGTIFGAGDQLNFGRTVERLRAGRQVIVGSGRNALPLVHVTDVVSGLILALDHVHAAGQAYNIGNDQPLTQEEFLRAVALETGLVPPRLRVPYRALYAAAYAAERFAMLTHSHRDPLVTRHGIALFGSHNRHAIDKAKRELGYSPQVDLRAGIRQAAAWYQNRAASGACLATAQQLGSV